MCRIISAVGKVCFPVVFSYGAEREILKGGTDFEERHNSLSGRRQSA